MFYFGGRIKCWTSLTVRITVCWITEEENNEKKKKMWNNFEKSLLQGVSHAKKNEWTKMVDIIKTFLR